MDDGGMGSLRLWVPGATGVQRFGAAVAELEFTDSDGVPVSVSLYVDQEGRPFELDLFKADFSALRRLPDSPD